MAPTLATLKQPIALRPDYVATRPTKLSVVQKRIGLTGGDFTISTIPSGDGDSSSVQRSDLFFVEGRVASIRERRHFRDASGLPLFELTRKATGVTHFVQLPGAPSGAPSIATIAPRLNIFKDKFDVFLANAADYGREVVLEARGQDIWKLRTNIYYNGAVVVTAKMANKLTPYVPGIKREWIVDVAEGMDLSLAAVMAVHLVESLYNMSMESTHSSNQSGPSSQPAYPTGQPSHPTESPSHATDPPSYPAGPPSYPSDRKDPI